jgi:hypothetical protein
MDDAASRPDPDFRTPILNPTEPRSLSVMFIHDSRPHPRPRFSFCLYRSIMLSF